MGTDPRMMILFLTVGVVAVQTFQSPAALGCNFTQLQQLLNSSKCELLWDIQDDSVRCRTSTDPDKTKASRLYNISSEMGHLWFGNTTVPKCSSVAQPAPRSCTVCYDQRLHVVCSNLRTEDGMVELEDEHESISTIKSACPTSLGVALTCSLRHLSSESNSYQLSLHPRTDTKWENPTINWEETKYTLFCTSPLHEAKPKHYTTQGPAEEGRQRPGLYAAAAAAAAAAIIWGIWYFKCRKSISEVTYSCATQKIMV